MAQRDFKGELRAALLTRELKKAKRRLPKGNAGIFMQVALALSFMYLIVFSYSVLGVSGPMFVSIFFLVALLMPVLYHAVNAFLDQRRAKAGQSTSGKIAEVQQQG